ncbi:hypothetical protein BDV93DRAFT_557044 [Ceratobasidium sp. AG-I]|nr:hypothetical protein BDV93DRAFT_557044 [Ceratobasidium sp. AG-I]
MKTATLFLTLFAISAQTAAGAVIWGQCGGQGWYGDPVCPAGSSCIYLNTWHSQCLPNPATTTTTAETTASTA